MANIRSTFAKRQRELNLKDKADAKQARRAAKRNGPRPVKGPPIAWDAMAPAGTTDEGGEAGAMSDEAREAGDEGADEATDDAADDASSGQTAE